MKKVKQIIGVVLIAMLWSCGQSGTKNAETSKEESVANPYIELSTEANEGDLIYIQVDYPEGEEVWADFNNNQQIDEGEKLERIAQRIQREDMEAMESTPWADGEKKLQAQNFKIYGNVTFFCCGDSKLVQLDVSNAPNLEELICVYNQLTSLDVSKNHRLTKLYCTGNNISELDISKNPLLCDLMLRDNPLKSNVYDFSSEMSALTKTLQKQNDIPKNYHIYKIIEGDILRNGNDNMLVFFEENMPYAERQYDTPIKRQLFVFEKGNTQWKKVSGYDASSLEPYADWYEIGGKNILKVMTFTSSETYNTTFYKLADDKLVKGKTYDDRGRVISEGDWQKVVVSPNAKGEYEVHNADEFLSAMASDRVIKIMVERIDLTAKGDFPDKGPTFTDLKNVTIEGGLEGKRSEIVLDDRERTVLIFEECKK